MRKDGQELIREVAEKDLIPYGTTVSASRSVLKEYVLTMDLSYEEKSDLFRTTVYDFLDLYYEYQKYYHVDAKRLCSSQIAIAVLKGRKNNE